MVVIAVSAALIGWAGYILLQQPTPDWLLEMTNSGPSDQQLRTAVDLSADGSQWACVKRQREIAQRERARCLDNAAESETGWCPDVGELDDLRACETPGSLPWSSMADRALLEDIEERLEARTTETDR
ncbi:MAG: hypothetical protein AAFP67_15895 [Pseudomonadota bacterium]